MIPVSMPSISHQGFGVAKPKSVVQPCGQLQTASLGSVGEGEGVLEEGGGVGVGVLPPSEPGNGGNRTAGKAIPKPGFGLPLKHSVSPKI